MFWRHFGCSCGARRAERLIAEYEAYRDVGLTPVIIAQGEPARTALYRSALSIPCPVLCDPDYGAYRSFVVGADGVIRLAYDYQYCEDYPDPRVLTTASRLS